MSIKDANRCSTILQPNAAPQTFPPSHYCAAVSTNSPLPRESPQRELLTARVTEEQSKFSPSTSDHRGASKRELIIRESSQLVSLFLCWVRANKSAVLIFCRQLCAAITLRHKPFSLLISKQKREGKKTFMASS